jgi:hypothetical protein
MKLFKKVLILSALTLSVGSSVAFGVCNSDQQFLSGTVGTPVVKAGDQTDSQPQPAAGSKAGSAEVQPSH